MFHGELHHAILVLGMLASAVWLGYQTALQPIETSLAVFTLVALLALLFVQRSPARVLLTSASLYAGTLGLLNIVPTPIPGIQLQDVYVILLLCASAIILLLRHRTNRPWVRSDLFLLLFLGWMLFRLYGTPKWFDGIKDATFLIGFWTTLLLTRLYIAGERKRAIQLLSVLVGGALVAFAILGGLIAAGLWAWTSSGLNTPIGKRPVAIYLMVVLAAALGLLFLNPPRRIVWLARTVAICSLATIVVTLSRTVLASIAMVHIPLLVLLRKTKHLWRIRPLAILSAYVVAVVLAGHWLLSHPIVQQRMFFRGAPIEFDALFDLRYLNAMGRQHVWPMVIQHALERPWIGHGTGSVRSFVFDVFAWEHPHSDYLRVLHDQGLVGLFLFLGFWLHKAWRLAAFRFSPRDDKPAWTRHLSGAALATLLGVMVTFITDNTMVYTHVMLLVAIILGCAESCIGHPRPPSSKSTEP